MRHLPIFLQLLLGFGLSLAMTICSVHGEPSQVTFSRQPGAIQIKFSNKPVAVYVYEDPDIPRPFFCNVHAPDGTQVTRNHPPVEGKDPADHALLHPGIWMAFGDLTGADNWRNRDSVLHNGFVEKPTAELGQGTFTIRNIYLRGNDRAKVLCREQCRVTFLVRPVGYLLLWESTFHPVAPNLAFGDQEEMGLGVRVASPIMVRRGGRILNSQGQLNEKQVWGKTADWCDYSGRIGDRRVGVTLMCDPKNFRPSWFHARDYGLLVANPFGRKAFGKGEPSRIPVTQEKPLRLGYAVFIHSALGGEEPDLTKAYADYLQLLARQELMQTDE